MNGAVAQAPGIPAGVSRDTIARIPAQLRRDDLRFIRIPWGSKGDSDNPTGWTKDANYSWDDKDLKFYLDDNWNYGVFPSSGSPIVILDADEYEILTGLGCLHGLDGNTFTVASGSSTPKKPKYHYYISCPGLTGKTVLNHPSMVDDTGKALHLGEIFAQNPGGAKGYVIGPSCRHPAGGTYTIETDKPILSISKAELDKLLSGVNTTTVIKKDTEKPRRAVTGNLVDTLGIRIEDVCQPDGARRAGDEIRGGHPVHGSTTGDNLSVNPGKGVWRCHRHSTGGDALVWIAVQDGIIDCSQAGSGCLDGHWHAVFKALERRGHKVPAREGAPDTTDPLIEELARAALEEGDILQFFKDTFAELHSGDSEIVETIILASCSQGGKNTQGIQPGFTGATGTGKSDGVMAAMHLLPPEFAITATLSNKYVFYMGLEPGTVIYCDDTELSPEMNATVKRCRSNFQEETVYFTLDKNRKPIRLSIPPRTIFMFSSVLDQGDDQLADREYRISLAKTTDADKNFLKFVQDAAVSGVEQRPVTQDVLVCREMIRQIRANLFSVKIPFANEIDFSDPGNRRDVIMYMDFVKAVTIMNSFRRKPTIDEDGTITISSTHDDARLAARVFKTNAMVQRYKLSKDEIALWQYIAVDQGGEVSFPTLVERFAKTGNKGATIANITRLLTGRDGKGGLASKAIGLTITKESQPVGDVKRMVRVIKCMNAPTLSDYVDFVRLNFNELEQNPSIPEIPPYTASIPHTGIRADGPRSPKEHHSNNKIYNNNISIPSVVVQEREKNKKSDGDSPTLTCVKISQSGIGSGTSTHRNDSNAPIAKCDDFALTPDLVQGRSAEVLKVQGEKKPPLPPTSIESILSSLRSCGITKADLPPADKWTPVSIGCSCLVCHVESHKDGPVMKDRTGKPTVHRVKTGLSFWECRGDTRRVGPLCDSCKNAILAGVQP